MAVGKKPFYFTIPVPQKNLVEKRIRDIKIKDASWKRKLVKSIQINYRRSAYFEEVFPVVKNIIFCETDSLSVLNKTSVVNICEFLQINTDILPDPDFDRLEDSLKIKSTDLPEAFRDISMYRPSVKLIRLIKICRSLDADTFVNPIGGSHLYPKEEFIRNNLKILFLKMKEVRYQQNANTFYPGLSIIDVLMNCGGKGTSELLKEYELF